MLHKPCDEMPTDRKFMAADWLQAEIGYTGNGRTVRKFDFLQFNLPESSADANRPDLWRR